VFPPFSKHHFLHPKSHPTPLTPNPFPNSPTSTTIPTSNASKQRLTEPAAALRTMYPSPEPPATTDPLPPSPTPAQKTQPYHVPAAAHKPIPRTHRKLPASPSHKKPRDLEKKLWVNKRRKEQRTKTFCTRFSPL